MDRNSTLEDADMSRSTPFLTGNTARSEGTDQNYRDGSMGSERSIPDIVQELFRDVSVLVEREGQLLRQELSEKANIVKASGMSMIAGGALIFFGVQALVLGAILALSYVFDWWVAAVVVGAVLLAIGGFMAMTAKKAMKLDNLKPTKSADALSHMGVKLKEKAHELYH